LGGGISNNGAGILGPAFFIDILHLRRNAEPTAAFQTALKILGARRVTIIQPPGGWFFSDDKESDLPTAVFQTTGKGSLDGYYY
jgi:hypothetical protein